MTNTVSGPGIRLTVRPEEGGRIVSLVGHGQEWLQRDERPFGGSVFVQPGMGGWDEVAPTVSPCRVELPGTGPLRMGDHGDLWNRPWDVVPGPGEELLLEIQSLSLPVTLRRNIRAGPTGIRIDYTVTNRAEVTVPWLWCAHPQLVAPKGTLLALEGSRPEGDSPLLLGPEGQPLRLGRGDVLDRIEPGRGLKTFVRPDERVRGARLHRPDRTWLHLSWDPRQLPYLGLWWDHGSCASGRVIGVEPTTGWGDSLQGAVDLDRVLRLAPGQTASWRLDVRVGGPSTGTPVPRPQSRGR